MEDEKIIALYFARNEDALVETASRYGGYCTAIAGSILDSDEDIEECVSDTWLRAWGSIPPTHPNSLKAYLGKITRNLAIHRYEKARAEKRGSGEIPLVLAELGECLPDSGSVEQELASRALSEALDRFLSSLTREKRIVFLRRYWYGASVGDIARDLSMSEPKVKSMLHRMRGALKRLLEKEGII